MRYPFASASVTVTTLVSRYVFRRATWLVILLICACTTVGLYFAAKQFASEKPAAKSLKTAARPDTVRASDRGQKYFHFRNGGQPAVEYRGNMMAAQALQSGQGQPRAVTSSILAANAVPDLISGYSWNGAGIVTVQHGNPEAFAPLDESVFKRMQQRYNPDPLLPATDTYTTPESVDFIQAGDFNHDGLKDVLTAARGSSHLYLLPGDGRGGLKAAEQISVNGAVRVMTAGEFRGVDGFTDFAVGVDGPSGSVLEIFDGAPDAENQPMSVPLPAPASGVEFKSMDKDGFLDAVVLAGGEVDIIHGWGRKHGGNIASQVERINLGVDGRELAVGVFIWNRAFNQQVAVLSSDGVINIWDRETSDVRPYSDKEQAQRNRALLRSTPETVDPEAVAGWEPSDAGQWIRTRTMTASSDVASDAALRNVLVSARVSPRGTDDLMVLDGARQKVIVVRQGDAAAADAAQTNSAQTTSLNLTASLDSQAGDLSATSLDLSAQPAAVFALPQKLNGEGTLVVMEPGTSAIVPITPAATITVDRTDDPTPPSSASACVDATPNDCSLRGAVIFANVNSGTTISIPAGTYKLTIEGTSTLGCDSTTVGDLNINNSTVITGAGSGGSGSDTTIIQEGTGVGPGNGGDRVMCLDTTVLGGKAFNFSGLAIIGGRDSGVDTAGGIIGGSATDSLTLTNVRMANNQSSPTSGAGSGGGAIQIVGGDLTITNSFFGGSSAPLAFDTLNTANRDNFSAGNQCGTSGGAINWDPNGKDTPNPTGGSAALSITNTTFQNNVSKGGNGTGGGGGLDINFAKWGSGGAVVTATATLNNVTFTSNSANNGAGGGFGGALLVESGSSSTVNSVNGPTTFTSNSAGNGGGAMYQSGSVTITGNATHAITFSGNTAAVNKGSSIGVNGGTTTINGTNIVIGGDIAVFTNGFWVNAAGSTIQPNNFLLLGGSLTCNNSTMNIDNDFTLGHETNHGFTFNGNSSTINIKGDLSVDTDPGGAFAAGAFNAGTSTFTFNGTTTQSIADTGTNAPITFFNLTDSNTSQPLTISNSLNVGGTLTVNSSTIFDPVAGAVIGGAGTITGSGTARVRRTGSSGFLNQYTISNKTLTNLTVEYIGASAQDLSPTTYGPLKINNGSGVAQSSGTATVNGLLSLTSGVLTINNGTTFNIGANNSVGSGSIAGQNTSTVVYNQGADGQSVIAGNYGNLQFSNFKKTLPSAGTVGISNAFTPGTATGHTISSSTVDFNGTGAQTVPAFNFNNLTISGARGANSVTLVNGGTIGVAGTFSPTATFGGGAYVKTNNTFDFNGTTTQTVAGFDYNNLTISGARGGATISLAASTIRVAGAFSTPATAVTYSTTGNTFEYNGSAAQTMPSSFTTYNNLTLNNAAGVTPFSGLTANGLLRVQAGTFTSNAATFNNVQIDNLTTLAGTSGTTIDVKGNWANNGTFTHNSNTVNFNGSSAQLLNGTNATTFNDLTINNVAGVTINNLAAAVDATVNGALTLTTDLTVASSAILQQGGTSAGSGDVVGTVRRTDLAVNVTKPFGNQFNTITVAPGSVPTQMDFNLGLSAPAGFASAVLRNYTLTPTGSVTSATLALHYRDSELNSNTEANLGLWRGTPFTSLGRTSVDTVNNQVTLSGITGFSPWAIAAMPDVSVSVSPSSVKEDGATNMVYTFARTGNTAGPLTINFSVGGTATFNTDYTATSADAFTFNSSTGTVTFGAGNANAAITVDPTVDTSLEANKTVILTVTSGAGYSVAGANFAATGTITDDDSTTTITSDNPDPSFQGASITVNYTVTVGNGGTPTGNVTVGDGVDSNICTAAAGTCSLTLNTGGNRTITATYSGDANYNTSQDTEPHFVCTNQVVTNTNDSGAGSLRQALADSCDGGSITFNIPDADPGHVLNVYTISLTSAELAVSKSVTITGPNSGANTHPIFITGNSARRVFNIAQNLTVNISNLRATQGSTAGNGGAILANEGSTLTLTNVTVSNSTAGSGGGGISTQCSGAAATTVIVKNSSLTGNTASGDVGGGAIYQDCGSTGSAIYVDSSTIDGNHSTANGGGTYGGGGISIQPSSLLYVSNSTISKNDATKQGGGIYSGSSAANTIRIINTTISGNSTKGDGGGIYGPGTLVNSTVTNNRADSDDNASGTGGGIFVNSASVSLFNTLVAGNFHGAATADDIAGVGSATGSFNLIGTGGSGGLTDGVSNNQVGVATPGLASLANNGGATQTHALLINSPAIEAGSDVTTLSGNGGSITSVATSINVADASVVPDKVSFVIQIDNEQMIVTAKSSNTLIVFRAANGTVAATHNDGVAVNPAFDQRGSTFPRKADSADPNTTQTVDIGAYEAHPTIEDIGDTSTNENTVKNVTFNLGDDTGALITSVTASSSNTTLVPNGNLVVTGSAGSRNLQITPAANQTGSTTITVTVTATNGRVASDTFDLTVNAVNDPPTANAISPAAFNEDTQSIITLSYSDPESDLATACAISSPTNVSVTQACACDGAGVCTVGVTGTPDYFGSASFGYTVTAGGQDSNTASATLTINPVNDPPSFTIAANPPAVAQDAGPQTVNSFATSISPGAANEAGQVLTFNLSQTGSTGTLSFSSAPAINSSSGALTYTANNGTSGTATYSVTLSDNGSNVAPNSNTSGSQSFTITVNPPNASPVVTTTGGNLAYTENAGAVAIDPGLTITDGDDANLTGATVAITAGFVSAQDTLAFTNQLGITGNYNSGTGVLSLTGTTTVANYEAALRTITYANSSDDPTASRTITFNATDGISTPGSATRGIAITANNDAPVNTVPGSQSTNEDTARVFSSGNGNQISVADADLGANPIKITLTGTNGTVTLSTTAGLSFTTGDGTADATMIFTGTLTAVNTALNGMSFNPTADFNGAASVQIVSDDQGSSGTGGAMTDTDTVSITVNAVNDAPEVTTTAGNLTYNENDPATAIDSGLTVTDVDSANLTGATVAITFGFVAAQDTLAFTNQNGISGNYTSGTGVLTLTGTSSVANYQAALRSVTYQNSSDDPTASRTVTFTATDGTDSSSPVTRGITITSANDSPSLTTNAGLTVVGGGSGTIDNTKLKVTDPDNTDTQLTFQITTATTNGTLKKSGVALAVNDTFTQDDINNNRITYDNVSGIADSFNFTYTDGTVAPIGPVTFNITTGCGNSISVTSNADSGNGSLRQAISAACANATISFSNTVTSPITLTSGELVIDKNLTINGPNFALTISGNSNSRVFHVNPGVTAAISNLTLSSGRAAFGGAVYNEGTLTITGSTIVNSTTTNGASNGGAANGSNGGSGAGIYNSGTLNVINSTISGNTAGNGGDATGTGIGGNGGNGGGLYNGGTLLLVNSTFSQNRAGRNGLNTNGDESNVDLGAVGQGGGFYSATATAIVRNTISAGNLTTSYYHVSNVSTSTEDINNDAGGTFDASSGFNLIGAAGVMTGIDGTTNGNQVGAADAPLNPLLGPLTNNGGVTNTYLPQQFSPAIDAGSNALAKDQNNNTLTLDQRGAGFPRILNSTVDIGSVETTPPPPPPSSADVSVTKTADVDESLPDRDVTYTITVQNAGPNPAVNVNLTDTLPGTMTFVSLSSPAGWSCGPLVMGSGGTVDCSLASLGTGSPQTFTLVAHIPAGTVGGTFFQNTANVALSTSDPDLSNNSYPAGTTVVSCLAGTVVTNNADSGLGSLRQAIAEVCDGGTVTFAGSVVSPITLVSELVLNKNVTIQGPGAGMLTISGNNATRIFNLSGGTTNTISGLTLANARVATAGTNHGGAIFNNATLQLDGMLFNGNSVNGGTSNQGGGIYNTGTVSITNSTFSNNAATSLGNNTEFGGAITNTATLTLANCTFSANSATGGAASTNRGGAVYNGSGTLTLVNSTFANNNVGAGTTSEGGGVDTTGGTVNIRNTLVAGNSAPTGPDLGGAFTSQGKNLIGKVDGASGFGAQDQVGTVASPINALLAPLGNYGGPTATIALLPGSPAIDAGNTCVTEVAHCSDPNISQLTLDQRGFSRQAGTAVDIGAFESRGFTIAATSGTPQSAAILTAFGSPLLATVNAVAGEPVSGGQVRFTAPGSGASATFAGGVTTIAATLDGSGQASVTATANGTAGGPYNVTVNGAGIAAPANFSLTNSKANQAISFGAIADKTFGDVDFAISATASSGLPVSFSATGNCTVTSPSPGTVHLTGAGSCTITASQGGDANNNAAPNVQRSFNIAKANQTITFNALANRTFGDPDFSVSATANSGLPVSFSATGNCTVTSPSPGTVHITGAGSCTITASQAGNANFNAATNVPQSFNIAKANQTITFAAIANKTFGNADFVVSPTASSGLPVTLGASGNCTVTSPSPGTVHITGAGSCTITASQAGDANYNAAANVPQSFNIAAAASTTAVSSSVNPSDLTQNVTFTATVSSSAGTPTGTVQFKDNGTNIGAAVPLNGTGQAQVSTAALTAGTHTITADYSGDGNFLTSTGTLSGGQVVKPQPTLSINDVSTSEGQAGTKVLNFTVTLSAASNLTVTANFATANGTATAGSDYVATNGTVTFNPGDLTKTISVTINGDVGFEPDETFTVTLTSPTNAGLNKATGTGTIQNDDAQGGFIGFSTSSYSGGEAAGVITVTVVRTNDVSQAATVDYATDDTGAGNNCAAVGTGLASQRCDYTSLFGTLQFAANETQKTLDIPINLDAYTEGLETFTVKLSNPTGGAVLVAPATAIVTIVDSNSPTANAIDDTTTFVRQQYRDFLNRDADPSGLAFWKNNIDKCNDPAQRPAGQTLVACIEVQRILTSGAFFLSIEFKQTGGLVRDFYVAALNRPLTNNMPDYVEFMRDTQAIQRGVVVGQGNWQQVLDANRVAFMNEFVTRPEFAGLYPTTDTPTQYVDKLYGHAAVPPANPGERAAAIAEFGSASTASDTGARGRALLKITQNPTFQAREVLRGFVQMQYFGYLRRNPNAPPDNDFSGYDFWLNKLIQFNGDFLQAEMVKAFITSGEYRKRFGP